MAKHQNVQAKMVDDDGDGDYWRTDMGCQHGDAQDASCCGTNPEVELTIVP